MTAYTKKRILLILTGGTIAGNVASNEITKQEKSQPDSFLSILKDSTEIVKRNWSIEIEASTKELFNVDSSDMLPANWSAMAETIAENYDEYDAFIILHGTNTMGYTGAALSFALENVNKPVILTGAQVPLGYLGSDATTNLVNSLRLAVWGYHPIKGVMAVFGSKIIAGTRIKKGTDFDYDPYSSFIAGALGQIGRFIRINDAALDKYISYLSKSKPLAIQARVLSVKKDFDTKSIASLTEFPGMSPDIFQTLVEQNGIKAFVFRAFGAGDASQHLFKGFEYLKEKQIPIVVTSQAPQGVASFQVNESGKQLKDRDLAIPAYDMSIESITTKLAWLLAQGISYEQIKSKMLEDLHGEINIENELL
ncbi:MAG: asparaginase [Candidatus Nomurabacteria bacterium]|nr:MAG: asparaginase [Candidatus Nomurabacteria bacterium]